MNDELEERPPVGPHIAVQLANGLVRGIRRYAKMFLIERPDRVEKILPVALVDIRINPGDKHNHVEVHLMCSCENKLCTRRLKLSGSWRGAHPQKFGDEYEKMAKELVSK